MRVLEHLRHPNVVTFYGAVTRASQHHAIVVELCLGSVYVFWSRPLPATTPTGLMFTEIQVVQKQLGVLTKIGRVSVMTTCRSLAKKRHPVGERV